ncbi:hypothetical protein LTR10_014512 [Elasticomyces elasticus]|uniref:Uncharacterized protein n=1 Tax=Exophiala sideris TaxID=1016849 RepID=A0ABR0JST6_9EURO|nr:hypothetical protein LTR10_014512 [Elasticomyces elasticus]KAK5040491.1 hypothetical protein LTS07_000989 [Exophiala sideris]KAK5043083.1 hypothetical protein LTR13_000854 [Exophiala sideris]KAK5068869.1 hypothetical protein LTR69_000990 [Exophiala sideris]KAK5186465.1 hypothetical protein LTR44_001521 [Eurotiomycetes sp. CCFEE 6388]
MRLGPASEDSLEPGCTITFFDCLSPSKRDDEVDRVVPSQGVEREMQIMYQQPHLVPPMKLTVYDGLPTTPTPPPPSQLSHWVSQGKASLKSGLALRKHTSTLLSISSPHPPMPSTNDLPLRRAAHEFRPLELSIYMPNNRLSNLPEFDRLSFTDVGEIKLPPRAVLRTQSEQFVPHKVSMMPAPVKPASMIEQRRMSRVRPDTSSTVISTSRPPSEYDALHSHPVSWASLPGLPPPIYAGGRSEPSVAILTPMQEEFSPPVTSVTIDGVTLAFPKHKDQEPPSAPHSGRPSLAHSSSARNFSKPTENNTAAAYFHPNYQTQKQISQWLAHRNSSSISTTKSSSSLSSFAEHRKKRSQFYQLTTATPKPLQLPSAQHQRTMTESTVASTVESDVLSFEYQNPTDVSVTTADSQPRIGNTKSISKSLRPIVSGVPDVPPAYAELLKDEGDIIIKELGGPLRSPGVGVAF